MPIYLYRCGECKTTREYFVNNGQSPIRCANEDCETPRNLTRVWDGQTISMRSSGSNPSHTYSFQVPSGTNLVIILGGDKPESSN